MESLGSIFIWLITGLVAGFLAGRFMRSRSSLLGDFIVGIIGAIIGGFLAGLFGPNTVALVGNVAIAFAGACLLIWLLRFVTNSGTGPRGGGRRR